MPTLNDLQPQKFTVEIRGVILQCSPLRLSHALIISKIGKVLQEPENVSVAEIKQAERDMDEVINELIPELKTVHLDMMDTVSLITQMAEGITPEDSKFLDEQGVKFDDGLKAQEQTTSTTTGANG
jgi:hypothetical protein